MLKELIGNRIEFLKECDSWETAITTGAALLLKDKLIKQEYIDSMIANIHKFGAYIVLTDGVAMPHSRPEMGVLATGMGFLKLEKGVLFPETHEPISLFFTLAAENADKHLDAMMELADILGNDAILERLKKITTKEELLEIIL